MAEEINEMLGVQARVIEGARGEFSVRVNGRIVAEKTGDHFPTPSQCVEAVKTAL